MLEVVNDTILPALWTNRVSADSTVISGLGACALLTGAVKERRIEGDRTTLSGVEGAVASAII